jgi:hypothetical protein
VRKLRLNALTVQGAVDPGLRERVARARRLLSWAFGWLPGAVVVACAGMAVVAAVGRQRVGWWLVLPVVGALVPFVIGKVTRVDPPRWPHTTFLTAAGQLVFGAIPAYGIAAGTANAAALPLFLLAWANVIAGIPVCRAAYRALMLPLAPALGSLPLDLRFGVRVAIEQADTITTGVTVGLTHVVAHARRHVPNSQGNPAEIAVPLGHITAVRPVVLDAIRPWLSLSDGTRLLATPGPAVALRTPTGEFLVPTDDAGQLAEIIRRRCALASPRRWPL